MIDNRVRVLFTTCWYPHDDGPSSGVFIKEHAEAISLNRDYNLFVYFINVKPGNSLLKIRGIDKQNASRELRIESVLWKVIYHFPWLLWPMVRSDFAKNVSTVFMPQIIHSNVIHPSGIMGHWLSLRVGCPLIISEHWSHIKIISSSFLFSRITRKAYEYASFVLPVSKYLSEQIRTSFHAPIRCRIVPNIVNDAFSSFKYTKQSALRFVVVSSWRRPKRADLIFNSLELFSKNSSQPVELFVLGNGPLLLPYKDKEYSFSVSYIHHLPKDKLAELFCTCNALLCASDTETFSVISAEALSVGLPVLASNVGALPELVNESNGVLVNNEISEWLEGLSKISSIQWDRESISANMRGKFSKQHISKLITEIYRETLS